MAPTQSLLLDKMDHSLGVLSKAVVAYIPHEAIRAVCIKRPTLADAFNRQVMVDGSIFREWIANVGRRMAMERFISPCVDGPPLARDFLKQCLAGRCGRVFDLLMRYT